MRNKWFVTSAVLFCILVFLIFTSFYPFKPKETVRYVDVIKYVDRVEYRNINVFITERNINLIVKAMRDNYPSEYNKILDFYDKYTGNRAVTEAIISRALEYDNPINMMFALAKKESDFNFTREVYNKSTKTWDRGLFQLNSGSRKTWKKSDFLNPDRNSEDANGQIAWLLSECDSDELALASFNAGYPRVVDRMQIPYITALHVFRIKDMEKEYDIAFSIRLLPTLNHIKYNDGKLEISL